jgi:transcriptional regulator with XRE-family HTH domain
MTVLKPNPAALRIFGDTVRSFRKQQRLRQAELAQRAGLNRSHIGEIEHGKSNITLDTILRLAGALRVAPTQLLHPLDAHPDLYATFHAESAHGSTGPRDCMCLHYCAVAATPPSLKTYNARILTYSNSFLDVCQDRFS